MASCTRRSRHPAPDGGSLRDRPLDALRRARREPGSGSPADRLDGGRPAERVIGLQERVVDGPGIEPRGTCFSTDCISLRLSGSSCQSGTLATVAQRGSTAGCRPGSRRDPAARLARELGVVRHRQGCVRYFEDIQHLQALRAAPPTAEPRVLGHAHGRQPLHSSAGAAGMSGVGAVTINWEAVRSTTGGCTPAWPAMVGRPCSVMVRCRWRPRPGSARTGRADQPNPASSARCSTYPAWL